MRDLTTLSATEASTLIASGELTSEALVIACLERVAAREPDVHAWAWIDEEFALSEARKRDREAPLSPLHGIPIGIKDIIDTADIPTARGSAIYRDRVPSRDATCVASLRRAGAVVLGKTITTEFAASHPGPTRNPLNIDHTPGGSSSGSAAAVADRMVPLSIGTQTSGSVVRPASFCGVFALKPTVGVWPTQGVQPLAPSLDTLGVFARDYRDLSLVFPHMGGASMSPGSGFTANKVRVGFARTPFWDDLDRGSSSLILELVDSLVAAGIIDSDTSLPSSFSDLAQAQLDIFAYESARALEEEYSEHRSGLSEFMREWLGKARTMPEEKYDRALDLRMKAGLDMSTVWERFDVLLAPAVKGEALEGLVDTGDPLFCRPWTTLGGPVLAVPLLHGSRDLPIGMQLTGPPGSEGKLIAAAEMLMQHAGRASTE